jgi:hypothetical protein
MLSSTKFKVVLLSDSQLIYWYNFQFIPWKQEKNRNKSKLNATRIILIFYNDQCLVFIGRIRTWMDYDYVQVNYMQSNLIILHFNYTLM